MVEPKPSSVDILISETIGGSLIEAILNIKLSESVNDPSLTVISTAMSPL